MAPTRRSGRPPVPPRPGPAADPAEVRAGQHATERVPLPPSSAGIAPVEPDGVPDGPDGAPAPLAAPETGQLDLGSYPPRVPGRPRPDDRARRDGDGRGAHRGP
ncbi:hypothetical protein [Modestobacter versicolor]|uniref:hypothetical protein n=1 Tax=Modestobacter versicolor TaxID=429133 RepID=UPI0034E00BC9